MSVTFKKVFNQFDPSYDKTLLGLNTDPKYDIHNYGCLLCSLATILTYYGKSVSVADLNKKLGEVGGWVNGGEYVWGSLSKLYPDVTEKRVVTPNPLTDEQLGEIRAALDRKMPVLIEIDYNPSTVNRDMHFVVVVSYNPADENDLMIADPLGGEVRTLKTYLAFFKPSARITIQQYIIFEGKPADTSMPSEPVTPPVVQPPSSTPAAGEGQIVVNVADNEKNVKMATQYKEVVSYLEIPKAAEDTLFEDVRRVIAGLKSRLTDLDNKRKQAEEERDKAVVEASHAVEEVGRVKEELTRQEKLHKVEMDALKQTSSTPENSIKQMNAVYGELKGKYDGAMETIKKLRIELAQAKGESTEATKVDVSLEVKPGGVIKRLVDFLVKVE